ncbi:hypothetical protein A3C59_02700 [Candidatus Daviesbacteria bacterium RIFCSPHIGHO2_02_FULL_36_13]|uniref:peptidylprolyl isomerase n=1 Tax=Candidatus Daviesbacteria bacterium RIFCSPHIGHO2_02_FULL_36_13 TaxID=1797768 RepID=A0A1F5JX00_9BACT|nr:MAG: hypothetical protein A3C59_02700 [Candidatus Daviesbacteria bacterium RIFCSPHIGHO2_02_FULL_36_13]OGE44739.1 MAG: hypothetical protein A3A45_02730 [Candidatus Daviesbacteria bacterium RIFCSPLOWO2_01_FULL_36_8]
MPKRSTKKSVPQIPGGQLNNFLNNFPDKLMNFKSSKKFYLIALILGILLLAIYKKNLFVAAMVNGQPVTNWQLQSELNSQFRTQTLNQLINEKIILDEAKKNNAIASQAEIDQKIAELEIQVGGAETLDGLLSQQGQTRSSIRNQIRIQLAISKLYEKDATVSSEEVTKYIEENKAQMQATDSAGLEKEATEALKQQKLSQIFSEKFQQLRSSANIQIF